MYIGWFVLIFVIWAWLTGGSIYGWREHKIGAWLTAGSVVVWTGVAGLFVLFALPYWKVVYLVLLQPG
ncbi:hypothetical protein [Acidisoma sp.]|uniref:hypothetical protein n=1 Tax=Acidisoma sp. TaxID=1872115 RepID=UPI003B00A3E8